MAIFGGRDAELPLLTQFYQLEVPTGWQQAEEYLCGSELETWDRPNDCFLEKEDSEDERLRWLKVLADLHFHATLTMRAAADKQLLPSSTFHYLNGLAKTYLTPSLQGYSQGKGYTALALSEYSGKIGPDYAEMLRDLLRVASGEAPVSRCESCNAVYLERREIQKYCSWRCSNRERVRRQRQKAAMEAAELAEAEAKAGAALETPGAFPVFATAQNKAAAPALRVGWAGEAPRLPSPAAARRPAPPADDFDNDCLSDPFAE